MKSFGYIASGALVVLALALGTPEVWAQARPHGGGGGGGGRPSGGGGGGSAVSRGSGGGGSHSSGGSGGTRASGSSGGTRTAGPSSTSSSGSSSGTAVERDGSRNNYGHPTIGGATNRTRPYDGRPGRGHYYYPYDPYYLYGYGAFGLGAFYYDPFWWGYPYGYGPYGYPYGYGYGYGYGYYDPQDVDGVKGGLKLKVTPKEAEVYADGYYVGAVDDYDGAFQRLNLVAGTHRIEIRARGYEPLTFEVKIEPRETITYRGDLPLQQAR